MANLLLGQQGGYVKYPCFLCQWHSRADGQHSQTKDWPVREELVVGENNVINETLVDRDRILLPLFHIKLGLMKQFVKVLDKNGDCFRYIHNRFIATSVADTNGLYMFCTKSWTCWESTMQSNPLSSWQNSYFMEITNCLLFHCQNKSKWERTNATRIKHANELSTFLQEREINKIRRSLLKTWPNMPFSYTVSESYD